MTYMATISLEFASGLRLILRESEIIHGAPLNSQVIVIRFVEERLPTHTRIALLLQDPACYRASSEVFLKGILRLQPRDIVDSFAALLIFHILIGIPELRILLVCHLLVCMVITLCNSAVISSLVLPNTDVTIYYS